MKHIDFLRSISRCSLDVKSLECIKEYLKSVPDPLNEIYPTIRSNKVQYLFFYHLHNEHILSLTKNKLKRDLGMQITYIQYKHKEYLQSLGAITGELERQEIPYCILKGFSLIPRLYTLGNRIVRDIGDIDLLVDRKDLARTDKVLQSAGFCQGQLNDNYVFEPATRKDVLFWSLNFHQEHKYTKPSVNEFISPYNQMYLDLNTSIFEGGKTADSIPTSELLKNYRIQQVSPELSIRTLTLPYELIQLCYHFYKDSEYPIRKKNHCSYFLMHFCDIREYILLHRDDIDWNELYDILCEKQITSQIYFSLSMVNSFYGDLDIDEFLDKLRTVATPAVHEKLTDDWASLFIR